ncbi:hypothetical protein PG984_005623 [Apiospora sp. TS-2023a]
MAVDAKTNTNTSSFKGSTQPPRYSELFGRSTSASKSSAPPAYKSSGSTTATSTRINRPASIAGSSYSFGSSGAWVTAPPSLRDANENSEDGSGLTVSRNLPTSNALNGIPWIVDKRWPSSQRNLGVRFMNGSWDERQMVKDLVTDHFNTIPMHIRFAFLRTRDAGPSDIRVEFKSSGRTASHTTNGRDSANVSPHKPTMTLRLDVNDPENCRYTVLHEFGHALGLRHEHQHPDSGIVWKRKNLLRCGYTEKAIDQDYMPRGIDKRRTVPYDKCSIMHWHVYAELTRNLRRSTPRNTVLSRGDKAQLMEMYPVSAESKAISTATSTVSAATTLAKGVTTVTEASTNSVQISRQAEVPRNRVLPHRDPARRRTTPEPWQRDLGYGPVRGFPSERLKRYQNWRVDFEDRIRAKWRWF